MHDPEDVELSILKQRLARRLEFEGHTDASIEGVDLTELTKVSRGYSSGYDRQWKGMRGSREAGPFG